MDKTVMPQVSEQGPDTVSGCTQLPDLLWITQGTPAPFIEALLDPEQVGTGPGTASAEYHIRLLRLRADFR